MIRSLKMFSHVLAPCIAIAVCSLFANNSAAQSVFSPAAVSVPMSPAGWKIAADITQFNPAIGTLTEVEVTLRWQSMQEVTVLNFDGQGGPGSLSFLNYIYGDFPLSVTLTLPNASALSGVPADQTIGSFFVQSGFLGTYNVASFPILPNTKVSTGALSTSGSNTTTLTGASIANFIGTGSLALPVTSSTNAMEISDGGALLWYINQNIGATITVVYTYSPNHGNRQ